MSVFDEVQAQWYQWSDEKYVLLSTVINNEPATLASVMRSGAKWEWMCYACPYSYSNAIRGFSDDVSASQQAVQDVLQLHLINSSGKVKLFRLTTYLFKCNEPPGEAQAHFVGALQCAVKLERTCSEVTIYCQNPIFSKQVFSTLQAIGGLVCNLENDNVAYKKGTQSDD